MQVKFICLVATEEKQLISPMALVKPSSYSSLGSYQDVFNALTMFSASQNKINPVIEPKFLGVCSNFGKTSIKGDEQPSQPLN